MTASRWNAARAAGSCRGMCLRLALLSFVLVLAACAPSSSTVVDVPASVASEVASSNVEPSSVPSSARSTAEKPAGWYCADRGLVAVDMCPEGHDTDPGDFVMPEALGVCCAAGPVHPVEIQPCFAALYGARACRDKTGERNVAARIEQLKRAFGEPCQDKGFRDGSFWLRTFRKICAERGFPPTAADEPRVCGRTDETCPPQWPKADW